jgi:hypothetical protein
MLFIESTGNYWHKLTGAPHRETRTTSFRLAGAQHCALCSGFGRRCRRRRVLHSRRRIVACSGCLSRR